MAIAKIRNMTRILGAVILASLLSPTPAAGQGKTVPASRPAGAQRTAAVAAWESGRDAFLAGHYAKALEAFKTGYQLSKLPGFVVNVAATYFRLGELRVALGTYKRVLMLPCRPHECDMARERVAEIDRLMAGRPGAK